MELYPKSENGKRLNKMLRAWIRKSPETTKDILTRVLLMYTIKMENLEYFVDALYGQQVLEEPTWDLTTDRPTTLSRVRHAIGTSVSSSCVKELVVAFEWSKNEAVLGEILKWAEEAGSREITEAMSALSTIDLAPARVQKTFSSLLSSQSGGTVSQRERTVNLNGRIIRKFGVCRNCNSIIIGLDNSQIRIYQSLHLQCETVLPYYNEQSELGCFQCTCTEIIAGYEDGNICSWDIKSGALRQKVSAVGLASGKDFPHRMRWRNPKLVVAARNSDRIQIWQYIDSCFSLLGGWPASGLKVCQIEFDQDYVILQDAVSHAVSVYFPNGKLLRRIQNLRNTTAMAYQAGILITGGADKILRIWDVGSGVCLQKLEGHSAKVVSVEVQKNILLSGDYLGTVIVWDMYSIMGKIANDEPSARRPLAVPSFRTLAVKLYDEDVHYFVFGRSFIVVRAQGMQYFRVIDFP